MRLSALQSRILALALLLGLAGLLYAAVASPVWKVHRVARDALAEHESQIARLLGIAADSTRLSQQRDALRARGDLRRYLLGGSSTTLAAAALQERIKSTVEATGGRLTSTRVLGPEAEHGFTRVAIGVRLALHTSALQQVLYELEGQAPLLEIDDLMVIARRTRSARQSRNSPANLDVRFSVSGFMPGAPEGS